MISIIIPVYKNYEAFFQNLENNRKYFAGCEVIVMNDYPNEKIAYKVNKIMNKWITVDNEINLGFGENANKGVKLAKGEFIFLLNSDVRLRDDSFKKSVELFSKDIEIFAVAFAQYESGGNIVGANRGFFKDGLIYHEGQSKPSPLTPASNFWAEGGSSVFRKKLFLELGSFDPLYNPFYWEDIDLSYRAWKSGYKIYYYPQVKVQHFHESTIGKFFQKSSILKISYRNQFIFNWKNITDYELLIKHLCTLPLLLLKSAIKGNWLLVQGFFSALLKIPLIIKSRNKTVKLFKIKDSEILDLFK